MPFNSKFGQGLMVIGAQWGDEGKGKLIDVLSEDYDVLARCQGGANAGHTIVVNGIKHIFHLLPSGMLHPKVTCYIGAGVVVHLETLLEELDALESAGISTTGRIFISDRAHIVTDLHKEVDGAQEELKGANKVGTTKRGIGPTYEDKAARVGIRMCDLLDMSTFKAKLTALIQRHQHFGLPVTAEGLFATYSKIRDRVVPMITDVSYALHQKLQTGNSVLIEGANGILLDIDHGTYPYVTSSNTVSGGAATGLGIAPNQISHVIGTVKAYATRVGSGPFPTELTDATGDLLRTTGGEFGSTTGRPRRCGWLDIPTLQYSIRLSGIQSINLTKLDVLSAVNEIKLGVSYSIDGKKIETIPARLEDWEKIQVTYETLPGWKSDITNARSFEELPATCQAYVKRIESLLGVPITFIGVGPAREQMIVR